MLRVAPDLARLVAAGTLESDEAEMLMQLSAQSRLHRIRLNLQMLLTSLLVAGVTLAFRPTLGTLLVLAIASLGIGSTLFAKFRRQWELLSRALVDIGIFGICAWVGIRFTVLPGPWPFLLWPTISLLLASGAITYRDSVLAALAAIAIGSLLSGLAGYWHVPYSLAKDEPVLAIMMLATLGAIAFANRHHIPRVYQQAATILWLWTKRALYSRPTGRRAARLGTAFETTDGDCHVE